MRRFSLKKIWILPALLLFATAGFADSQNVYFCDEEEDDCDSVSVEVDGEGVVWVGDDGKKMQFHTNQANRGFLGIGLTEMSGELRNHFGAPEGMGVMINSVEPDSPAFDAGLEVGDIVTLVDGDEMTSTRDVIRAIRHRESGDLVDIEVWRDGGPMSLSATLAERQKHEFDFSSFMHQQGDEDGNRFVFDFDMEGIEDMVEKLQFMGDGAAFHGLHEEGGGLHERLREMEERIQELERELAERD